MPRRGERSGLPKAMLVLGDCRLTFVRLSRCVLTGYADRGADGRGKYPGTPLIMMLTRCTEAREILPWPRKNGRFHPAVSGPGRPVGWRSESRGRRHRWAAGRPAPLVSHPWHRRECPNSRRFSRPRSANIQAETPSVEIEMFEIGRPERSSRGSDQGHPGG